jgi:ABC-type proline/glycine betaine transport system substrate-binding protein
VRSNFSWLFRHPVALMITAVGLWMLFPPIVNYLVDQTNVFYVAAVAHSFAAISTLACVVTFFIGKDKIRLGSLISGSTLKAVVTPTIFAGFLIFSNHLLLYAALSVSEEFDVIAILVFETWPILFFYIDSALRRERRKTSINDYVFSGAAFAGFLVLAAPNVDMADWLLLDSPMLQTMGLAAAGGLAMAINCYYRMKCMDAWSAISDKHSLNLSDLKRGLLTESGARVIAAPLLILALLLSGTEIPSTNMTNLLLLAFVGVAILALGSLLYDLSVFGAENASISVMWYLMPVGAVLILAVMQGRLLNQYEAVASALIVSSNIFLALKYPLRSSLLVLFVSVCTIGIWILFAPIAAIDNYYDLLAVSTVFFVLLATFALDRTTSLNRERESLLGEFNEQVVSLFERLSGQASGERVPDYKEELKRYVLWNIHSFLRAFSSFQQLAKNQKAAEQIKYRVLPLLRGDEEIRERVLGLFKVGDKLLMMESDRIPSEEFVILILLGATNVFFSLIFRPDTLAAGLFALIVGAAMIYLLLIIFERDKYAQIRHDHAMVCKNLVNYVGKQDPVAFEKCEEGSIEQEINEAIKAKSGNIQTRGRTYWIFSVFAFLFLGFGYGFLYESLQEQRSLETSPLASTRNIKETKINIALFDWPTGQIKGHILAGIINQHTELNASLVSISSEQAFSAMDDDNGIVDIHPDLWVENVPDMIRRYVTAFGSVTLGRQLVTGSQGLCYTDFGSARPISIADLSTPEIAATFDLSGDGKGDIWVGAKGWASVEIEKRRLSAYGLESNYNYHVFDPDVLQMLVERNNQSQQRSLFFCYHPDALFMDQRVRFINEPAHNPESWSAILNTRRGQAPEAGTAWPDTDIKLAYRSSLATKSHELVSLLNSFTISNKELVTMLASVKSGKTPEYVARQWITSHQDTVLEWLTGFQVPEMNTED